MAGRTAGAPSLDQLVLVPRPRALLPTGLGPRVEDCSVRSAVDPSLPRQGFRLDITADRGAVIAHRDDAGLTYALALLDQLLAQPIGGHVLAVHVEDHPDIAEAALNELGLTAADRPRQDPAALRTWIEDQLTVSVVVTSYNHVGTIRRCLDGVLGQRGLFRMQVVIGDDVPGELAPNPNPGVGAFTYDAGPVNLVIAGAKLGDTISFAYTANYAVFQNYGARGQPGHHFVDLAVQAWPQTVAAVCAEAEKRGTR